MKFGLNVIHVWNMKNPAKFVLDLAVAADGVGRLLPVGSYNVVHARAGGRSLDDARDNSCPDREPSDRKSRYAVGA